MYLPEESTVPPAASCTDQVTAVDCPLLVPLTVAVNLTVEPLGVDAVLGEMDTAITSGVTVTVALRLLDGYATLVAMT